MRPENIKKITDALDCEPQTPFDEGNIFSGMDWMGLEDRSLGNQACLAIGEQLLQSVNREDITGTHKIRGIIVEKVLYAASANGHEITVQKYLKPPFDMGDIAITGLFASFDGVAAEDNGLPLPLLAYYWKRKGYSVESPLLSNANLRRNWHEVVIDAAKHISN